MRRISVIILTLIFTLSLAACGGSLPVEESSADATDSARETTVKQQETEEKQKIETASFTLEYPTEDGWIFGEENLNSGEGWDILSLYQKDKDGENAGYIIISCGVGSCWPYREKLYSCGIDAYKLIEKKEYDLQNIGGSTFVRWENKYGDIVGYYSRSEAAETTIEIEQYDLSDDAKAERLLKGLNFHLKDIGHRDPPWYWEGEPFSAPDHSAAVGNITVHSQWIPFTEALVTHETYAHDIEVLGNEAYLLVDGILQKFKFDGSAMTYEQTFSLKHPYERLESGSDGTLRLSGFKTDYIGLKNGKQTFTYGDVDCFASAPDGSWGISYVTSPECEKYTFTEGVVDKTRIKFSEAGSVDWVRIDEDYIYVAGNSAVSNVHELYVYNHQGKLLKKLQGENGNLGYVTFAAQVPSGFIALDGNMRAVVLWDRDGKYLGIMDHEALFGAGSPWLCSADVQADGSVIVLLTGDRQDDSAKEVLAYRLSGFEPVR